MINYFNLLAISVSTMNNENLMPIPPVDETPKKIAWSIILILTILICIFAAKYLPEILKSVKTKKKEKEQKKIEKSREDELERLHEIKRKNKRK